MADFRRDREDRGSRGGFNRNRGSFGRGSRGGFGDRDRGMRREKMPMVDAVCDKCGKDCKLPFKPTEGKPVFCSECFEKKTNSFGSRDRFGSNNSSSGISKEQFDELNTKLNKILEILESIEFEDSEDEEETN